jgi:hypothetical protein
VLIDELGSHPNDDPLLRASQFSDQEAALAASGVSTVAAREDGTPLDFRPDGSSRWNVAPGTLEVVAFPPR